MFLPKVPVFQHGIFDSDEDIISVLATSDLEYPVGTTQDLHTSSFVNRPRSRAGMDEIRQ